MAEKIYVVSVFRQSAQGRHNYEFVADNGTSIPTNRTKARGATPCFTFQREGTKLITGLEEMVPNDFFDKDKEELGLDDTWASTWDTTIRGAKNITKQTYLEILDKVSRGTYTVHVTTPTMAQAYSDINLMKNLSNKTYLEGFKIYLQEGTNVFSSDTSRGRLAIQLCKTHSMIANSADDVNPDLHEFYIAEEEEAIKDKVTKRNFILTGTYNLGKLMREYPTFVQYQVAVYLRLIKGDVSSSFVESTIQDYVMDEKKNDNGTQAERITKFNEVMDILTKEPNRLKIKYLIAQALNTNVFINSGGAIIWRSQKDVDNLYNLGKSTQKIEGTFMQEFEAFNPKKADSENLYYKLISELKQKDVKCE